MSLNPRVLFSHMQSLKSGQVKTLPTGLVEPSLELNDTVLLAKLSPADMVALEAKYHTRCLTALYNRARAETSSTPGSGKHDDLHSIAFGELVAYVEDFQAEESIAPVFKLADLAQMYKTRLMDVFTHQD